MWSMEPFLLENKYLLSVFSIQCCTIVSASSWKSNVSIPEGKGKECFGEGDT
jgi:hypothetical protein